MRVLVTGGAGFIGSHVAGLLVSRGARVTVLDNLSCGRREYVPVQCEFHRADVTDQEAVLEILRRSRPEVVLHLAAQANLRRSLEDPPADARANITGSLNVFEGARRTGARRVVFASTGGALYGEPQFVPVDEEHPVAPESPYGVAKLTAERYLQLYANLYGLEAVSLRLANVYGPRQDPLGEAGVVAIFTAALLNGRVPRIFGDGKQTRDFVYVSDVAEAFELALTGPPGIYNVGTGVETSVEAILRLVARSCGVEPRFTTEPAIPGELRRSCLAWEKARQELGWVPRHGLAEGIERTVRYFRDHRA